MKNIRFILILSCFIFAFNSCSTDVEMYTDLKDTTIVYGVLDVAKDTNVVKIIRAFSGSNDDSFNANQIALIADSSNYPGRLDVRFLEYKVGAHGNNYLPTGRAIILDTITVDNKEEGTFYFPKQKLYYTTERFNVNSLYNKYKYKLLVSKPNDTVSSEVSLIGGERFQILTPRVFFKVGSLEKREIVFTPDDNDAMYKATMQFNYKEVRPGQDTVYKNVNWSFGPSSTYDIGYQSGNLYFTYREERLFSVLENAIGDDNFNVERFFDSFVITIFAYGKELDEYVQIGGGTSSVDYYYTNIHGGMGILSSCHEISKEVEISRQTMLDLISLDWGFKNIGY